MPVMTLSFAAAHLDLPVETLHCWRTSGHLVAVQHPCQRDVWLVDVQHLLEVELAMRQGTATRSRRGRTHLRAL